METNQIQQLLESALELDEVHVTGEGSHFNIIAVGQVFDGMSRVKKQQFIYAPLSEKIADGTLHAISIKAFTPEQWKRERQFNMPG